MFALCITNITFYLLKMSSKSKVNHFLDQLTSEAGTALVDRPPLIKRVTDFIGAYQPNLERLFDRDDIKTYEEFMDVLCETHEQSFVDAGMPEIPSRVFRNLCRVIDHKQTMHEFDDVMEETVELQGPNPDDVLSFGSSAPSEGDLVSSVDSVHSYDSRGSDNRPGGKKRNRTHRRKCKSSKRRNSRRRHRHRTHRSKH